MNMALPMRLVPSFEERLERAWWNVKLGHAKRRDALMLGLGLCGLRWIEIGRLGVRDVDAVEGRVVVHSAKGGVDRVVHVGVSWTEGIRAVWKRWPAEGYARRMGCAFYTWRACEAVDYRQLLRRCHEWTKVHFGRRYSLHCLRHTAALRKYLATRDVVEVQRYLGHRSLSWTAAYLRGLQPVSMEGLPSWTSGDRSAFPRVFNGPEDEEPGRPCVHGATWTARTRRDSDGRWWGR
jgi:integrase